MSAERGWLWAVRLLSSVLYWVAFAAAAGAAQSQARADNCSVAIHGNLANAEIRVCPESPSLDMAGLVQLHEILSRHEFDPELLTLLNRRAYDSALRRVEAVAAARPSQARHYYSLAGGIQALRGNHLGALHYARLAYEDGPNDIILLSRYLSALWIAGRANEALLLQNAAYRRRGQFAEWGRLAIELFVAVQSYSDSWTISSRFCRTEARADPVARPVGGLPIEEYDRAVENSIGTCTLDQDTTRAVQAYRARIAEAGLSLQRLPSQNVTTLAIRHTAAQFVLLADVLLRDASAASASMADLRRVDEELLLVGGPWALLNSVAALAHIDLLMPPEYSRSKYEMYDQAMLDAALVPSISYDPSDLSNRAMIGFNSMMLGAYRAFRARIMVHYRQHAEAWGHAMSAARTLRAEDDSPFMISVRVINFDALVHAGNAMPEDAHRSTFIDSEYNSIVNRFRRNPGYLAAHGGQLLFAAAAACAARRLTQVSCRRSLISENQLRLSRARSRRR